MQEWSKEQREEQKSANGKTAFYLYTPMCGTCQVASRLMDVTEQVVTNIPMGKANLNYMEQLAVEYEVESVPCLLISQDGEVVEKVYAFQSVPNIFEKLSKKY